MSFFSDLGSGLAGLAGGVLGSSITGGNPLGTAIGAAIATFAVDQDPGSALGSGLGAFVGQQFLGGEGSDLFGEAGSTFGGQFGETGVSGIDNLDFNGTLGAGLGSLLGGIIFKGAGESSDGGSDRTAQDVLEDPTLSGPVNTTPYQIGGFPRAAVDTSGIDFLNYGKGAEQVFFE